MRALSQREETGEQDLKLRRFQRLNQEKKCVSCALDSGLSSVLLRVGNFNSGARCSTEFLQIHSDFLFDPATEINIGTGHLLAELHGLPNYSL